MIPINTARWLDRKIGRPLCLLLALLPRFRQRLVPETEQVRKILVIKMWGIGTIVLASPVFYNLRRNYPNAEIHFLTLRRNRNIYEGGPGIDGANYLEMSSIYALFKSFFKILFWLWRKRFDIVFDFELGSRFTAILTFLSVKSLTVGYAPAGSGKNIFDVTIAYNESVHITQIYLRALDALNLRIFSEELLELPVSEENHRKVETFLENVQLDDFIVLNPNTSELIVERLWPLKYYAELGKKMLASFPRLGIVIIGGTEDVQRVAKLAELLKNDARVVSAAGHFSIRETTCLLGRALVLVSNDSGPLHLGVAVGVPTIGLFGPETPLHYGPRGTKHTALTAGEICSPCVSVYKDKVIDCQKDAICMKNITVETVYREVEKRLKHQRFKRAAWRQPVEGER